MFFMYHLVKLNIISNILHLTGIVNKKLLSIIKKRIYINQYSNEIQKVKELNWERGRKMGERKRYK